MQRDSSGFKMRECAFCPNKEVTGEHLISDWVNKLLEEKTHHYSFSQRLHGKPTVSWNDTELSLEANVACFDCNSGWMSDLENEQAKPILKDIIVHDAPVSILPLGAASIAAFVMKCGFVADYLVRHRKPFFDARTRYKFAQTCVPRDEVHMWTGRIRQPLGKKSGIYKTTYGNLPFVSGYSLDTYVFTFSIETLLLQLAVVRFIDSDGSSALSPELNQEQRLDDLLVPLWPLSKVKGYCGWPPRQNIQSHRLEEIADRFGQLNITD